ncbi:hypothetical protein BHF68_14755 [Desulfuribacillus alkaliarsenatis]|uniref:DUF4083 domain-containing protein n=1 Tax=Desulfuribacillus alkaliarsenatis TaxID=766136 RepID=A0A1E5G3G9_9FIRM|nr:hypothetical protein BHF68_14755 [Desulfuribacillus alkaliarsenatis]
MDTGFGLVAFFAWLPFLTVLFNLALIIFVIYFLIKVNKFINVKTKLDQERNEKIDELIRGISKVNKIE